MILPWTYYFPLRLIDLDFALGWYPWGMITVHALSF